MRKLKRLHVDVLPHQLSVIELTLEVLVLFAIFTPSVAAVTRFTDRSLFIYDVAPSAVTKYELSFTYTTSTSVGSLELLFCESPIPNVPCVPPSGLDVSNAVLSGQNGVTGYSITQATKNSLVLSRTPGVVGNTLSAYTFSNIVNPIDTTDSFAVQLSDYASTNATGPIVDLGSVLSESNQGITVQTQVPPELSFCVAKQVAIDCSSTSNDNYTDMGELTPGRTLTATSQMAAGTNASRGYVITVYGTTMTAGTNVINAPTIPTLSAPGNTQFGINLRANSVPNVGSNPDGSFTNAQPTPNYDVPNKYMYQNGDVVASAPNVALVRRFTVSYIVNVSPTLRAGVYTTTFTYICSGRF